MRPGSRPTLWWLAALGLLAAGCDLSDPAVTYDDPRVAETPAALTVALESPEPNSAVSQPVTTLRIAAGGTAGVAGVAVSLDGGAFVDASPSGDGLWQFEAALLTGENALGLRARSPDGRSTFVDTTLRYDGEAPTGRVLKPLAGASVKPAAIVVAGVARAGAGASVATVELAAGDRPWQAATLDAAGRFFGELSWPSGEAEVRARVVDDAGRETVARTPVSLDAQIPALQLDAPTDGLITDEAIIVVRGDAADDGGLAEVQVQVGDAGWITALQPSPFEVQVTLARGDNTVRVRALDDAGNVSELSRRVHRSRVVTLRATPPTEEERELVLELDRYALQALIPPDRARELVMLYLDVRGLLLEAIRAVLDPTGFGIDTSSWGQAEWNMQRLLTMRPDNVDVSGTTMEELLQLASNIGVPVPVLLADLIDGSPSEPFLSAEQVADGVFRTVIAPHPAMVVDPADGVPKVPITLHDAFNDLVSLGDKLGPSGDHPGVLFDAAPSAVMLPSFRMRVVGRSNLLPREGIDLTSGKAWLFEKEPGAEVVDLDFLDPETFQIQGLADEPEVDLFFTITEHPGFVPAGTTQGGEVEDGLAKGTGPVWDLPSWTFEHLLADSVYRAFSHLYAETVYKASFSYDVGAVKNAAKVTWDWGWVVIETAGGIGSPPPPAYWWDVVLELGQVRLHDGGVAEGAGDLQLTVTGARVPLSAEQLVAIARPALEEQKVELAQAMAGDHLSYSSEADLFVVRGTTGALLLHFVHPSDIPGATFVHPRPGLFADPGLTERRSTTADLGSGDTLHEKVALSAGGGEVYYAQDREGTVMQLVMGPVDGDRVSVTLRPLQVGP